jgi:hypothetical protein
MSSAQEESLALATDAADAPPAEFILHFLTGVHVPITASPSITIAALKRQIQQEAGTLVTARCRTVCHTHN